MGQKTFYASLKTEGLGLDFVLENKKVFGFRRCVVTVGKQSESVYECINQNKKHIRYLLSQTFVRAAIIYIYILYIYTYI